MRFIHANHRGPAQVDWLLTLCMVLGIGLLQFVLSEGNQKNWFQSEVIVFAAIISAVMIVAFVARSFKTKSTIAPVWLLANRNLGMASLMIALFAACTFSV